MSGGKYITAEEFQLAKLLLGKGKKRADIAQLMNRSLTAIDDINRATSFKELHPPRKRKPAQRALPVRELPIKPIQKVANDKVRTYTELEKAIDGLNSMFWKLSHELQAQNTVIRQLQNKVASFQAPAPAKTRRRFWE